MKKIIVFKPYEILGEIIEINCEENEIDNFCDNKFGKNGWLIWKYTD